MGVGLEMLEDAMVDAMQKHTNDMGWLLEQDNEFLAKMLKNCELKDDNYKEMKLDIIEKALLGENLSKKQRKVLEKTYYYELMTEED